MSKYRYGWPDLLLPSALVLALTGFFYSAMAALALYAVLYHLRVSRRARQQAAVKPLTREDVARLYGIPEDLVLPQRSDYDGRR